MPTDPQPTNWKVSFPEREVVMYSEGDKQYCFEMAWGSEPAALYVSDNRYFTRNGQTGCLTDPELESVLSRIVTALEQAGTKVRVSTFASDRNLPSHYRSK